ncbi:LOW QUALITY PROTEIN: uncharacterized protein M6G45_016670 [Spheniscus humboldti]
MRPDDTAVSQCWVGGRCKAPSNWDPKLRFTPNQSSYALNDLVQLSCAGEYLPSVPQIRCISSGTQALCNRTATCKERCQQPQWDSRLNFVPKQRFYRLNEELTSAKTCQRPRWDPRLRLAPNQENYKNNKEVVLSCPEGFQPPFTHVKCASKVQSISNRKPVYTDPWLGRDSRGDWIRIWSSLECIEMCQKPWWDSRLQLAPNQENYKKNQEVMLSCPEGFQPSVTYIKYPCLGRDSRGGWIRIQSSVEYIETWSDQFQPLASPPSRLVPSSPPCEAEEVKGKEMLHGQEETFACPPLQPFTVYSVTISLPPSTILFTQLLRTKEMVPDKPEKLCLDASMGSLRWKALPSCKGKIIGYQAAREHQLIAAATHNSTAVEGTCLGEPQPFDASRQPGTYVAIVLNLTTPTDFVLGAGIHEQGYHNAALRPVWDYMALSPPRLPLTAGQGPVPLLGRMAVVMALTLVVVALLALGIFLLFLLFRSVKVQQFKNLGEQQHYPPVKMLRRCSVCKLNTQILEEELLEALKRFKRTEIEETEDESINRHGAGHLREYQKLASTLLHPCDARKELCNQSKNCYKSIIPYDHCHAVLQPSDTGNGYINASSIYTPMASTLAQGSSLPPQGPLPGTVVDFWQMVWQEKTSVIVMLMGLVEQNKTKCKQYWPEQEQVYGDFIVTLNNTRTTTGLVTCIFCLQKAGCALPRMVEQFHYLLWPDHGVPRNPAQFLCLVEMVNKHRDRADGYLDFLLKMGKAEGKVDVFHCMQRLPEQRVNMVQTKEQYAFLYEMLLEGLLCGSTGVPVESVTSHVHCLETETSRHNNVLEKEFKALQKFSELFQLLPCREAEKPNNQPKNSKPGILPANSCWPILMSLLNANGSLGYINAVFANVRAQAKEGIVTQLPFPTTLVDFWALVWDYTCTSVVVLNQLQELDKTYVEFWLTQDKAAYSCFHIHLILKEPGVGFTAWTLALTNRQQPKKSALQVWFWQLKDWPMQQHLPPHAATIISLLGKVETHQRQSQDGHILITCW